MATKFTNGANLLGKALENARMHPVSSDPTSPADGQIWYREDIDRYMGRSNGETKEFAFAGDVPADGVSNSDFDAHTVLAATLNDDPQPVALAEGTVLGRSSGGNISAITAADLRAMLNVADGAAAPQTGAAIKAAYEAAADTNAFTDALVAKLNAIEANATGDQTAAQILAALLTVHGPASGLDADTLDGQQASAFQTVAAMAAYATTAYVDGEISALIGGAGAAYDTLVELQNELVANDGEIASLLSTVNSKSGKFATDVGDDTATTFSVVHNLNTLDCSVYVRSNVTNEMVIADVVHTGPNDVDVIFGDAPAVDEYRVIVQG